MIAIDPIATVPTATFSEEGLIPSDIESWEDEIRKTDWDTNRKPPIWEAITRRTYWE